MIKSNVSGKLLETNLNDPIVKAFPNNVVHTFFISNKEIADRVGLK